MADDGEDDGPGLGLRRKSPTGMSIQKHADALKPKDPARTPNSSLVGSNNASREQMPPTGNAESNRISTAEEQSSKQQQSSERITFNPYDKTRGQQ